MAFSGIARAFASRHKLTYVVGLFVEHIPAALLWFNPSKRNDSNSSLQRDRLAVAPSWSWFSIPVSSGQTFCSWIYLKTYQGMQRVATTSLAWDRKAIHLRLEEAFHNFTGLQMTLKAPAFAATISRPNTRFSPIKPLALLPPRDHYTLDVQFKSWHLDEPCLPSQSSAIDVYVAALRVRRVLGQLKADSLILKAQGGNDTWEWIGVCTVSMYCTLAGDTETTVPPCFTMWRRQYEKEFIVL